MYSIKSITLKLLLATGMLLSVAIAKATSDPEIFTVFKGSLGEIVKDPTGTLAKETIDDVYYSALNATIANPANDKITNVVSLIINETAIESIQSDFTARVKIKIDYTLVNGSTGTIPSYELEVTYTKAGGLKYNARQTLKFDQCRRVKVTIIDDPYSNVTWNVWQVINLENRMLRKRDYVFDYTQTLVLKTPLSTVLDEYPVEWEPDPAIAAGKTHVDIEWTWVDFEALNNYKKPDPTPPHTMKLDADLLFKNNSSRVTISSNAKNSYNIPLIYDGSGYLFYRIRPVQVKEDETVVNGTWTAEGFTGITYYTQNVGHEEKLNWQTTTSYAEDGKRKTVVQYFDGTLRGRQTVTKDNSNYINNTSTQTGKTVVAETFYDYQGRPAINILPAPTMSSVIQYTANFNKFNGTYVTPKDAFDLMPVNLNACSYSTPQLDNVSGASQYYSTNNPEKEQGFNKFIPDANGYPYTETRYTPDATGRIEAQGGVGEIFQLGKDNAGTAHDTKYFYGKPDQAELDALFGTEAGEASHYSKNMVRDANGQYSVSYVDMHGRTVATALAGPVPANLKALDSYAAGQQTLTKNLLSPTNNNVEGRSVVSSTTLLVTKAGDHKFHYQLNPLSAEIAACNPNGTSFCYDCYYDLEIHITGGCDINVVKTATNLTFNSSGVPQVDESCNTQAPAIEIPEVDFTVSLPEGEYNITKTLTVNKAAQDYYRDNLYKAHNICKTLEDFYNENYAVLLNTSTCNITCEQCTASLGTYAQYRAAFLLQQGYTQAQIDDPLYIIPYEKEIQKSYGDAMAKCDELCTDDSKNVLGSIRQAMLDDMTPDMGQYARLNVDLNGDGVIDPAHNSDYIRDYGTYETNTDLPYNIFNIGKSIRTPAGRDIYPYTEPLDEKGNAFYSDQYGVHDQLGDDAINLYLNSPGHTAGDLDNSVTAFVKSFQPSWADALIKYHPEYCKLQTAESTPSIANSYKWDAQLEDVDTWSAASTAHYIDDASHNGYSIVDHDPFFSGVGSGYKTIMQNYISSNFNRLAIYNGTGHTATIWKLAWMSVFCIDNSTTTCADNAPVKPYDFTNLSNGCTGDWNYVWRFFRTLYLSEKQRMVNLWLDDNSGCTTDNSIFSTYHFEKRFGKPEDYYNSSNYLQNIIDDANSNPATVSVDAQVNAEYEQNCESYKAAWISQLRNCDIIASYNTTGTATDYTFIDDNGNYIKNNFINDLTAGLKNVCVAGSDEDHPLGSSTVKPGTSSGIPASFQAVFNSVWTTYFPSQSQTVLCNQDIITYPPPYDKNAPASDEPMVLQKDSCVCARLTTLINEKNADNSFPGYGTLSDYIWYKHGVQIRQTLLDSLIAGCNGTCTFYDPTFDIPSILSCQTPVQNCIECGKYDSLKTEFTTKYPPLSGSVVYAAPQNANELNANIAFQNFMNNKTGFSKTWVEYLDFERQCNSTASLANPGDSGVTNPPIYPLLHLCGIVNAFPSIDVVDTCNSDLPMLALNKSVEQYQRYVEQQNDIFDNTYLNRCLQAKDYEVFTVSAPVSEYHYTLYYYDQAGNLVKTVPPAGVQPNFTSSFLADVKTARANDQDLTITHNLVTQYRYNALNQVTTQKSPDGGQSNFWYDILGRLVVSQNAKQQTQHKYSYTLYDPLGRISEVGEKTKQASSDAMTQTIAQNVTNLQSWLTATNSEPNKNITKTVYDDIYIPICTQNYLCQQNLRNRVSYTYVQAIDNGSSPTDAPWESATFYTYDIHGNVDVLLQDYKTGMGALSGGNRYKKTTYKYDLVSGKVNEVAYQPGYADAFYHKYSYDAENKLTEVYTSKEQVYWIRDAAYYYYRHGPLARTVLGDALKEVQGIDYAYTLQGWLKGVNATALQSGGTIGNGEDCGPNSAVDNLYVYNRLSPYPSSYVARNSINFMPSTFESNTPDNFVAYIDPALSGCDTDGTAGDDINSPNNNAAFDMGQDGKTNGSGSPVNTSNPNMYGNNIRTTDAYGFSLNYFNGDYNRIDQTAANPFAALNMAIPTGDANTTATAKELFNGNIGAMVLSVPKLGSAKVYGYNYDQLNRITNMFAFNGINTASNTFTPIALQDYKEAVTYDPNGNILTYKRNGVNAPVAGAPGGLNMDDLAYEYIPNSNKLKRVTDNPAYSGNYPDDIDNQTDAENYVYDEIGNLVQDKAEGITNIDWNVYGKIATINKFKNNVNTDIYYTYDASGNRISKSVQSHAGSGPLKITTTYYVRDASGNVMSVYETGDNTINSGQLTQTEIHLYGSSRLGVYNVKVNVQTESRTFINMPGVTGDNAELFTFTTGSKFFELSNHLGNVLVTISDKRIVYDATGDGIAEYYKADVITANDYYPFGMQMPGRKYSNGGDYRYGFNGKENDKDMDGNCYDYGFRIYNPALGRFLSTDPLSKSYPWFTPYQFAGNSPITFIDLDGLEMAWKDPSTGKIVANAGPVSIPVGSVNRNGWVLIYDPEYLAAVRKPVQKNTNDKKVKIQIISDATKIVKMQKVIPKPKVKEEEIMMSNGLGTTYIGPRSDVELNVAISRQNYYNAVADNIIGGPGGAAGYIIGGNQGSFYGAAVDGVALSFGGIPGESSVFPKITEPIQGKFVPYKEGPLADPNGGAARSAEYSNGWKDASLFEAIKSFTPNAVGEKTESGKIIYRNTETGIQIVFDVAGNYFRIQNTNVIGKRNYLSLDGTNPTNRVENGRTSGRNQAEYNQVTHFNNSDK